MSRRHNYITAAAAAASDASREIASGLPTVVVEMFLDDVCPEPACPSIAVNPPQPIHLLQTPPTGARSNEPPRPPAIIAQNTCEPNGGSSGIRGCSRVGRGGVVHRYHPSTQEHPQHQQQLLTYPFASMMTSCPSPHDDETKRRKNREAAARCRQRKSERIVKLEEKAKQLKEDNEELEREAVVLQNQIVEIRNTLLEHMHSGCPIRMAT